MVFGLIGIMLLAGAILGKIGWGWGVLGAMFLCWPATRFWARYKPASNAILARYTFDLLSETDRQKVLAAVSTIMSSAKYPSQNPEQELKRMTPEQRYGFIALGMARIGITPKIGDGWYEVRNPYAEILGAHREIAWVKRQIRLKYDVDVNLNDEVVSTEQRDGPDTQSLAAVKYSQQPTLLKDNDAILRQESGVLDCTTADQGEPIAKVDNFCQIDDSGFSVLHSAAWAGDNNRAIQLLDAGVDASVPVSKAQKGSKNDCEGATPLHFAVVNGCVDVAKILLTRGASVRAVTEYDETPLHWVVGISELIFDAMLTRGANHRIRNRQGATSLHLSATSLLNDRQRWGMTPCHPGKVYFGSPWPAPEVDFGNFTPDPEKIANLCLSAGIDVNDADYQGNTALHWACMHGNRRLVHLLMEKGGDLEQKSTKGLRPIDHTVLEISASLCKMLIDAGSPLPCLSSEFEDVAIFLKSRARHTQCKELADLLLEHDLFPNEDSRRQLYKEFQKIQNENTFTSFQHHGFPSTLDTAPVIELIDLLLKSGANMDAINKTGDTALLIAAGAGGITMLKYGRGFHDCYCRQY